MDFGRDGDGVPTASAAQGAGLRASSLGAGSWRTQDLLASRRSTPRRRRLRSPGGKLESSQDPGCAPPGRCPSDSPEATLLRCQVSAGDLRVFPALPGLGQQPEY